MHCERDGAALRLTFEGEEAALLERLFMEMETLVGHESESADPLTDRLFPRAYENNEDETKYRELIGDQLRSLKQETFTRIRGALAERENGTVLVGPDDIDRWLAGLTDTRLALGTRLQVTEEVMQADVEPDDPDAAALSVLHWLGWVQESILRETNAQAGKGGGSGAPEG